MKNKGFTLIEIIAVVIILGILAIIAVPTVSNYIESSRKSAYVQTIKDVLASAGANLTKSQMKNLDCFFFFYN